MPLGQFQLVNDNLEGFTSNQIVFQLQLPPFASAFSTIISGIFVCSQGAWSAGGSIPGTSSQVPPI
jgi:hypothetical protein